MVIHYHLRPGGVQRVVEALLPRMVRQGGFRQVVFLTGETASPAALRELRARVAPAALDVRCDPSLGYFSETGARRSEVRAALQTLVPDDPHCLLWLHNPGVGRNLLLVDEVRRLAGERGLRLLSHHHDFWFENRWQRTAEFRAAGFRSLDHVADAVFGAGAPVRHVMINRPDSRLVGSSARWVPDPVHFAKPPTRASRAAARRFLHEAVGCEAPLWLNPSRGLRRKNFAEGMLLTRWLCPSAMYVMISGASSQAEEGYMKRLGEAAEAGKWRVRFLLPYGVGKTSPPVGHLIAAADRIILTSLHEGFGLPLLEAAHYGVPAITRHLPNVHPDLVQLGFSARHSYRDVRIPLTLFDAKRERDRQRQVFKMWRAGIPPRWRRLLPDSFLEDGTTVAFSRLTLDAQLEVLAIPPSESLKACSKVNPFLHGGAWETGEPDVLESDEPFRAETVACRLLEAAGGMARPFPSSLARAAQSRGLAERLAPAFLYPLLMES